ncbi:MAG: hypothetical protein WDW38_010143 [Sanguina aurantia]
MMLIVSLVVLLVAQPSHAQLDFLYSVQRHGARNVLPKSALLTETDANGGPTLLPQGQHQTFLAGASFANRYVNTNCSATSTCLVGAGGLSYGAINTTGNGFNHYNTYVRSSALDRTLMSSTGFFSGIFPANSTMATSALFIPTGQQAGGSLNLNVNLTNWFNIYDAWNVWLTYGVGDPMPAISTDLFNQMTVLAYWLEVTKMRSNMTLSLLGGALLGEALTYLNAAEAGVTQPTSTPYVRFVSSSTHYNTQLGLMGALRLDTYAPAVAALAALPKGNWLATGSISGTNPKIPSLAAVLLLELVEAPPGSGGVSAVRILIQDSPTGAYTQVPLPCSVPGDGGEAAAGVGACTLPLFNAYAAPHALNSSADWCSACQNAAVDACLAAVQLSAVAALQAQGVSLQAQTASLQAQAEATKGYVPSWTIPVAAVERALSGAAFMVLRGGGYEMFHAIQQASSGLVATVGVDHERNDTPACGGAHVLGHLAQAWSLSLPLPLAPTSHLTPPGVLLSKPLPPVHPHACRHRCWFQCLDTQMSSRRVLLQAEGEDSSVRSAVSVLVTAAGVAMIGGAIFYYLHARGGEAYQRRASDSGGKSRLEVPLSLNSLSRIEI